MRTTTYFGLVALLFVLGCSNEELTIISNDENQLKKGAIAKSAPFSFTGNSTGTDFFDGKCWTETDEKHPQWNLFLNGNFSGMIAGYGIINPYESIYTFTECTNYKNVITESDFYDYNYSYQLTAIGILYIGKRGNNCVIKISGRLYPFKPNTSGKIIANFKGTAIFSDGTGNLKKLNGKTVNLFTNETSNDLSIGLLNLKITTSNF